MPTKRAESRTRYFIRKISEKRGWNTNHVERGGDFLEEQEIVDYFPNIGLGQKKPDFLVCFKANPSMVIEAKSEFKKHQEAIDDAIEYADQINEKGNYQVKIAVGVAGEEDKGYLVTVKYLNGTRWELLKTEKYALTTIPSPKEVELALLANDATTEVTVPSSSEFIDSAIEISSILRAAKIEAPARPLVLGAIITALYQGEIDVTKDKPLSSINKLVGSAVEGMKEFDKEKKAKLKKALFLTVNDFERLSSKIQRIITILNKLNIRSILHTDTDFLGLFYEAFLRYGYDNNALGIVFTPRHITRFCVDLIGVDIHDKVIDIASGTGGFLVAAFDKMMTQAKGAKSKSKIKESLYGFDTNPTVWALSSLNMFFRGDGKSHLENSDCFDQKNKRSIAEKFTRAFLNPPFSQDDEPERDFIDAAMEALEPGGLIACVVKAGIFADDTHKPWRLSFLKKHTLLGVISLPEDLFYPTAAPTSILIAKAHIPTDEENSIFMGKIWNDGYEKLKGKRVECEGSQLPEILNCFSLFQEKQGFQSQIALTISSKLLFSGDEFAPEKWLKQPFMSTEEKSRLISKALMQILQTITAIPEIADEVIEDFPSPFATLPDLPYRSTGPLSMFFDVVNGKSIGEKNYPEGGCPYISSGDLTNSVVRMVMIDNDNQEEVFKGGITVTAFGQACVQPWKFIARGNGGSSVRVLVPKCRMTFNELLWFAAQINIQKWRFFYGRMATKSRLPDLKISAPEQIIGDSETSIKDRITELKTVLDHLGKVF